MILRYMSNSRTYHRHNHIAHFHPDYRFHMSVVHIACCILQGDYHRLPHLYHIIRVASLPLRECRLRTLHSDTDWYNHHCYSNYRHHTAPEAFLAGCCSLSHRHSTRFGISYCIHLRRLSFRHHTARMDDLYSYSRTSKHLPHAWRNYTYPRNRYRHSLE